MQQPCLNDSSQTYYYNVPEIIELEDCSNTVFPACGTAYPNKVSNLTIPDGDSVTIIPNYEEDCSLVCFGENLLGSCLPVQVKLEDEEGSIELLETMGVEDGNCIVNFTIISEGPDYPGSEGTYFSCNVPLLKQCLILVVYLELVLLQICLGKQL